MGDLGVFRALLGCSVRAVLCIASYPGSLGGGVKSLVSIVSARIGEIMAKILTILIMTL